MNKIDFLSFLKIISGVICSSVVSFLGGWDIFLQVLVTLTVLDFITGILTAIYLKQVSSNIGYKGIIKKIGIYIMVAVAVLLDSIFNTNAVIRSSIIGYYIAIEGISIVENWGRMELPLPQFIKDILLQLKEKSDKGSSENEQS
ncbi:MAG: hypothetical protein PWQ70_2701 [Clostridiales bacterium]|nr:hypothetical protein [Clostridiales bacterium]